MNTTLCHVKILKDDTKISRLKFNKLSNFSYFIRASLSDAGVLFPAIQMHGGEIIMTTSTACCCHLNPY